MKIQNFIPEIGKNLTSYKGSELIARICRTGNQDTDDLVRHKSS